MEKIRALFVWSEWEHSAKLGEVLEPGTTPESPWNYISCPNFNSHTGWICGAHLKDLFHKDGKRAYVREPYLHRALVLCPTCLWPGARAIGKIRKVAT